MVREVGEAGRRQHHKRVAADGQQPQRTPQLGALLAHRDVLHFLSSFKNIIKVIVLVQRSHSNGRAYPEQQQHGAADSAERGVGVADVVPLGDDVADVVKHSLGREAQPQQALELRGHDDHRRRRREPARHRR